METRSLTVLFRVNVTKLWRTSSGAISSTPRDQSRCPQTPSEIPSPVSSIKLTASPRSTGMSSWRARPGTGLEDPPPWPGLRQWPDSSSPHHQPSWGRALWREDLRFEIWKILDFYKWWHSDIFPRPFLQSDQQAAHCDETAPDPTQSSLLSAGDNQPVQPSLALSV